MAIYGIYRGVTIEHEFEEGAGFFWQAGAEGAGYFDTIEEARESIDDYHFVESEHTFHYDTPSLALPWFAYR